MAIDVTRAQIGRMDHVHGVLPGDPLVEGSMLARDLEAHKARVLLMVGLAAGFDSEGSRSVFEQN
jgi:L-asparaginase/Glu-tRNA(Gln) amidotransferase subunit D